MNDALPDVLTRLRSSHAARNLDFGMLLLWSNHVATAVAVLREATEDLREPGNLAPFQKPGWWRKRRRRNAGGSSVRVPNEDAISDALVERIQQLQTLARPGSIITANRDLVVHSQQKRRRQRGIGPDGRKNTDFTFYRTGETRLDLRMEAKVLFGPDDLEKEYCSERGLLRYGDPENPYTVEVVGGMVAYCMNHGADVWAVEIESGLAATPCISGVGKVSSNGKVQDLLCCEVAKVGESLPSVVVFHLSLEFDTDPPSRPQAEGDRPSG